MWSITISYRAFSIVTDATSLLSKEMLYNCTLHTHCQTLICANGRSDLSGARPPFLFTTRTLHWLPLTKRVWVVISPELGRNVYFCWFFTKRLKSFTNHCNSIPLFWPRSYHQNCILFEPGRCRPGKPAPVTQAQCFCCSLLVRGNFEAEGERQFSVGLN